MYRSTQLLLVLIFNLVLSPLSIATACSAWNSSATYNTGDLIAYQGAHYQANRPVFQNTPPVASDNEWFWSPTTLCDSVPPNTSNPYPGSWQTSGSLKFGSVNTIAAPSLVAGQNSDRDWQPQSAAYYSSAKILINFDGANGGLKELWRGESASQLDSRRTSFRQMVRRAMHTWLSTGIDLELESIEFTSQDICAEIDSDGKSEMKTTDMNALDESTLYICATKAPNDDNPAGYWGDPRSTNRGLLAISVFGDINHTRQDFDLDIESYQILFHELGHALGVADIGRGTSADYTHDVMGVHTADAGQSLVVMPSLYEKELLVNGTRRFGGDKPGWGLRDQHLGIYRYSYNNGFDTPGTILPTVKTYLTPDVRLLFDQRVAIAWVNPLGVMHLGEYHGNFSTWHFDPVGQRQTLLTQGGLSLAKKDDKWLFVAYASGDDIRDSSDGIVYSKPRLIFLNRFSRDYMDISMPGLDSLDQALVVGRPGVAYFEDFGLVYAAAIRESDSKIYINIWGFDEARGDWEGPHKLLDHNDKPLRTVAGVSIDCASLLTGFGCRALAVNADFSHNKDNKKPNHLYSFRFRFDSQSGNFSQLGLDTHGTTTTADPEIATQFVPTIPNGDTRWAAIYPKRPFAGENGIYSYRTTTGNNRLSNTRSGFPKAKQVSPGAGIGLDGYYDFASGGATPNMFAVIPFSSEQLVRNSSMDEGNINLSPWFHWTESDANSIALKVGAPDGAAAHIIVNEGSNFWWATGFAQKNFTLLAYSNYYVGFEARTDAFRRIQTMVELSREPWSNYSGYRNFALQPSSSYQYYDYQFQMGHFPSFEAQIEFDLGRYDVDVWLDNVTMFEIL